MSYLIAIDLGGTKTITALIKNKKIIKKIKFQTIKGKSNVIKQLISSIYFVLISINKRKIEKIIIGVASPVDEEKGLIINAPNIKGLKNTNIKKILENKFDIPVIVLNDAKLQALGEYSINQNINSLFFITLGTGVGAAFVYKGKVFSTEFGHSIIQLNGNKCSCKNKGCLQAYVSGRAITSLYYKKYGKKLLPSKIFQLAKKSNKNAKKFVDETGFYLGIGLTNIINIFNPQLIIVNGGLSKPGNIILKEAKKVIRQNRIINWKGKIIISQLQEDALFYGAIYIQGSSAVGP